MLATAWSIKGRKYAIRIPTEKIVEQIHCKETQQGKAQGRVHMSSMLYEVLKEIRRILIFVFLRNYSVYLVDTCQNFGTTPTSTCYPYDEWWHLFTKQYDLRQTLYL